MMTERIFIASGRGCFKDHERMRRLRELVWPSSFHVSHWEGARLVTIDELTDAEDKLFKPFFSPIQPRAKMWLEPFKVTSVGKEVMGKLVWKGKNDWNIKRIKNEWKMQRLKLSNDSNKIITIGDDTIDLDRLKKR